MAEFGDVMKNTYMSFLSQESVYKTIKENREVFNSYVKEFITCQNQYQALKTKLMSLNGMKFRNCNKYYQIVGITFNSDLNSKTGGNAFLKLMICNKNGKPSFWRKCFHKYHYVSIAEFLNT